MKFTEYILAPQTQNHSILDTVNIPLGPPSVQNVNFAHRMSHDLSGRLPWKMFIHGPLDLMVFPCEPTLIPNVTRLTLLLVGF